MKAAKSAQNAVSQLTAHVKLIRSCAIYKYSAVTSPFFARLATNPADFKLEFLPFSCVSSAPPL
jgi:hypothetical protein